MLISDLNPWWSTSEVPKDLVGKERDILSELISYLDYRQMMLLYGIRRSGKTTLIHQLIDYLIQKKEISPFHIFYFSFDLLDHDLDRLLEYFQVEILKKDISSTEETIFFLIDEIQKLDDWANKIKILYDRYPRIKIILSGSAALLLIKGSKESLAGRFFEFQIDPLSFAEFTRFVGSSIDSEREVLHEREIKILIQDFLNTGGFIEAIPFSDTVRKKYFKESLLERVIFKDIPESFQIARPDLLFGILNILAQHPGMYLDYKNLGNDLNVDQRTVANYISYLEHSMIVKKLYNYSSNRLTSEKKLKRIYLANTAFLISLEERPPQLGRVLETLFFDFFRAGFFYRSPAKEEVDFVLCDQQTILPVEVKIRERIRASDLKPITRFMKRFDCQEALVISKQDEQVEKKDNIRISIVPYWKLWTIRSLITSKLREKGIHK